MEKQIPQKIIAPSRANSSVNPLKNTNTQQSVDKVQIWNDKNQYEDLSPEVWNFDTISHQICKNWLHNRQDCFLNSEDIQHYQRILTVLHEISKSIEEIKIENGLGSLRKYKLFEKVRFIVVKKLEIEPEQVTPVTNFVSDLGADSLEMLELVIALEEAFKIEIPPKVAEALSTVQQIINYISQKVEISVPIEPRSS